MSDTKTNHESHDAVCRACGAEIELLSEGGCPGQLTRERWEEIHRLNPALREELAPVQQAALETLSARLDQDDTATLVDLVGLALYLLGLDGGSYLLPEKLLGAAVDPDDVKRFVELMADLEVEFRPSADTREAQERAREREVPRLEAGLVAETPA